VHLRDASAKCRSGAEIGIKVTAHDSHHELQTDRRRGEARSKGVALRNSSINCNLKFKYRETSKHKVKVGIQGVCYASRNVAIDWRHVAVTIRYSEISIVHLQCSRDGGLLHLASNATSLACS